jgi:hypothetical protein
MTSNVDATHPLIAAVLAVTPIDPEGLVITGFHAIQSLDGGLLPEFGDPVPLAARQASEAIRAATKTVGRRTASWPRDQRQIADLVLGIYFGLADEIDPA